VAKPRHIEIQIIADSHGHAVHLGERECSIQRRHQKILEETPSPAVTPEIRARMGAAAITAVKAAGYVNAGTVEFIFSEGEFYFLEVNARLQVEHPITEEGTGIDLVKEQIRVAAGHELSFTQDEVVPRGHAIEMRINAENPVSFRPSPGKIVHYHPPGGLGVRVDSAVYHGYTIPPYYDSLVGKLIVHGKTRGECLMRLKRALDEFVVVGIDRQFTYDKLLAAQQAILHGAHFIATNRDPIYPLEGGRVEPGSGSIVAAIATASGTEPEVIGKPNAAAVRLILNSVHANPRDAVMIGDRIDTDIACGKAAGIRTVLVLTGTTGSDAVGRLEPELRPDVVLNDLGGLEGAISKWRSG